MINDIVITSYSNIGPQRDGPIGRGGCSTGTLGPIGCSGLTYQRPVYDKNNHHHNAKINLNYAKSHPFNLPRLINWRFR
jgi:hypothetical protein